MVVLLAAVLSLVAQDPADQLKRQELSLRFGELAADGKFEALSKSVLRELRGRRIDGAAFDMCWRIVGARRWEDRLGDFVAAWDKSAPLETPAPAQVESLNARSKSYRDLLEAAATRFPGEPAILWFSAQARFEAGELPSAARALEELAPLPGWSFDSDEFHRLLALCYAASGARPASIEHLRAIREDRQEFSDLAALANKCRLPEEAARFYSLALILDPERISLRMGLIRALQTDGDAPAAAAEREKLFTVNGRFAVGKVEDYFFLLPPEGRVAEITRTLQALIQRQADPRSAATVFDALMIAVPAEDRGSVSEAWEKSAADARSWLILAHMRKVWGNKLDRMVEVLEKGEQLFPQDPMFPHDKVEALKRLGEFSKAAAAYERLVILDPEGAKSGERPSTAVRETVAGLIVENKGGAALSLGVQALSDKAMDAAGRAQIRSALKPVWEAAGPGFWDQVRKLKLPPADPKVEVEIRGQLSKLSDDEFAVRSGASQELIKLGLPAIPSMLEHVDDADIEVRSRAREVIRAILSE